jgi:hypothetical protein
MLKRYRYLLLAIPALLIALPFLLSSEEDKILDQLEQLRGLAEVHGPEGGIQQATKAREIGRFFSEKTLFDLTSAGYGTVEIPDRQKLSQIALKGRATLASLQLTLHDPQVSIDGDSAQVEVRGSAVGSVRGQDGQFLDIHLIRIMLIKEQDNWLVSGAKHLRNERQQ